MEGIFLPQTVEFPTFNIFATLACALLDVWLIGGLLTGLEAWTLLFAVMFSILGVLFARQSWHDLKRFYRAVKIAAEVEASEEEI